MIYDKKTIYGGIKIFRGMVSQAVIQENMNYYEDYINEQIRNGKNEQDVLNELEVRD